MKQTKEYWLQSDAQEKGWGPFESENAAWHYLLRRKSYEQERKRYNEYGWYVGYVNKWHSD